MAHGGIAVLAVVFALAFALFYLARALASEMYSAVEQQASDDGDDWGDFTVFDTRIAYAEIALYAITIALLGLALFASWKLTRATSRLCPECRSTIPAAASICRFCTTELPPAATADA
jgi:hypothetical protein